MTDKIDTKAIRDVRKYKLVHRYDCQSQMLVRPDGSWVRHDDYLALCDALDDLRADNERLRAALQPFADYMHTDEGRLDLDHDGCELPDDLGVGWIYLNHGDFRRAYAALAQEGGE